MAARWGVGEESLTTGNMEFFTTYSLEEGHLSGEGSGLTLDARLDSADGLEPFHSCLDPSILSIFEDSVTTGEARGRLEEESEATLLTALTEILDNVDDENLSPFDTLPDSELFSGQRGREPSPLRRLLTLARSPPGREPVRSPKSPTPTPAKLEKVSVEWDQKTRAPLRVPDVALQRSDGEEEEEEGAGSLTPSSEGPSSPDSTEAGGLLSLDQDGRCVAMSLSDLVKHMHTYCLEVSLEPGEGDGLLPEGAIVLEVVDQGEEGEPVLAVTSSLGLMEALTANEEAMPQQEEEEEEQQVGGSSSSAKENRSLPAPVPEANDDENVSEERPRVEAFGKYPTGRKKKRKSDEGGGPVPEGRVLRSASLALVQGGPTVPQETGLKRKAMPGTKKKRVSFAPVLTSFLESPVDSGCGSESVEAPALEKQQPILEDCKLAPAPAPMLPEIDMQPCEAPSIQKEAPVSQPLEPKQVALSQPVDPEEVPVSQAVDPKPKPLSLQQYRLLRQQKKPAPVVKQEDQSTKWPSLPEPPTELLPIPCLVEPQPQLASKTTTPPTEPVWQPVGTEAPPTPQALLIPLASLGSASKAAATPAKPASVPKTPEVPQGPNPPREPSAPLSQKLVEPSSCKPLEPSRRSPPPISERAQSNGNAPTQGVSHRQGNQEVKLQQPRPSTGTVQLSAVGVRHQAQHAPPLQASIQTPKLQAIPIPGTKAVPAQQTAAPAPSPTPAFGPSAPGRPQRAAQKRLSPVQMLMSGKRNPRASQDSTSEIGIEATDLTSLLEQFEETQAKEEQRVPVLCNRAAAVGSSSLERQPDKKPLERPRGPDLGSTAGLTPPATPPHQVWKPLTPVTLLGKAKQVEGAKPSPSKAAQDISPQLPTEGRAANRSPTSATTPFTPKPAALKEPSAFTDHDYCLPTEKKAAEPPEGQCHSGNPQPGPAIKATPRTMETQRVATVTLSNAMPVSAPAKFVSQPLDHRTLTGSVLLSPDSSPCRPEAAPALSVEQPKNQSGGALRYSESPTSPRGRERGRTRRQYRGRSSSSESSSSGSSSRSSSRSRSRSSSGSTSGSRSQSDSRSPPRKRFRSRCSESSSSGSSRSSSHSPPCHRYSYSSSRSRSWSRSRSRSCSPPDPRRQWWTGNRSPSYTRRYHYNPRECYQWQDVKDRKEKAIEERRVVYVGKIRGGMTRKELKERFSQYGEIEECTLHFRDFGDNYGFVTYYSTKDAFNAIENGSKLRQSDELPFDLCFGGRRQFCKSNYADLDSNRDYDPAPTKSKYEALDFDTLLKQAQKGLKR
ncbi:peroxisome proliferator-activated receptor gamma coactivator-related protein 1 [Conger conger]|uniref:peroxisome proliferator-activated receptor gamma coactivator-related protein 1 n=1 Tax=Conger conger TaxID=82655 RepID=UPI002A5A70A5|nr:peroxisome proliferator-activated receptor gamma coactivator-related protein 1 [Conger conger]